MKLTSHINLFVITILIVLFSCEKEKNLEPPIGQGEMWDCYDEKEWDTLSIKNALIGEWDWEFIYCLDPENGSYEEYIGLTIEFKSDNTLDIKENGLLSQSLNWGVYESIPGLFSITADPFYSRILGLILFCDERVEFFNKNVDGCNNYYVRAN